MRTSDFDYYLPPHLIAQSPAQPRDSSRLLVLDRASGSMEHSRFFHLPKYLREGDLLVMNDSRVVPARLFGRRAESGGRVELVLLHRLEGSTWKALGPTGTGATFRVPCVVIEGDIRGCRGGAGTWNAGTTGPVRSGAST